MTPSNEAGRETDPLNGRTRDPDTGQSDSAERSIESGCRWLTRTPQHNTDGIGVGAFGWGRNKRWEYWGVTTPTHIVTLTVSSIDYAAVHEVRVLDRVTGEVVATNAIGILSGSATLPGTLAAGPARARTRNLTIDIDEVDGGTRLRAQTPRIRLDVIVWRPDGHEALGVVVPWNDRLFQYTVKDVARPAAGTLWIDDAKFAVPSGTSWAMLDHGRGRWPYSMLWNWGAGSGVDHGRVIGVQLGGKWTDGTGSTENALLVDGRLHKIGDELVWEYDRNDFMVPWKIHSERVDLDFVPFYDKASSINLGVFASRGDQCFGHYSGWMATAAGERVEFSDILGWAEAVHNRW